MELTKKEILLKESLKRILVYGSYYRLALQELAHSDTIKEWAKAAKENKNKAFVDLRVPAANVIRAIDSNMIHMRSTMGSGTVRAILDNLDHDRTHKVNIIVEKLVDRDIAVIDAIYNLITKEETDGKQ